MSLRTEIGSTGDVLMPVLAAVCVCVCVCVCARVCCHIHLYACLVLLPVYILRYSDVFCDLHAVATECSIHWHDINTVTD